MNVCQLCGQKQCDELLHFGALPISHRFISGDRQEEKHPLAVGQCMTCGLIQLINPIPIEKLIPVYEWIKYNEPESHLDHLVDVICNLPGITKDAAICGVSDIDDSTLARFRERGFNHTWRIDMADDLGIINPGAGIESIQDRLNPHRAFSLQQAYGEPDIVISRRIIEHTHNTLQFMATLNQLVKPDGYVVFETPDYTRALETFNYATIWEEHTLYFTEETFRNCFGFGGFSLFHFEHYAYPYESSLVWIVQSLENTTFVLPTKNSLEIEKRRAQSFSQMFNQKRNSIKNYLTDYRQNHGRIAMFGSGHVACMFINSMELKDVIEFVVDDDAKKHGYLMPGSMLPIQGSDSLIKEDISLCLLSFSPESEANVLKNNQAVIDQGGIFASIYPTSKYALQV